MGYLIAVAIIAGILIGPGILILRSNGPKWMTKILWTLLSLSATFVFLAGEPLLIAMGYEQPSDHFAILSGSVSRFLPIIYGVPIATYVAFRLLVVSKHKTVAKNLEEPTLKKLMPSEESKEDGKRLWRRSIIVGLVLVALVVAARIDGSPDDSNIFAILYAFLGFFVLWPYQIVLTFKLWRHDGDISKYLGTALSLASVGLIYFWEM